MWPLSSYCSSTVSSRSTLSFPAPLSSVLASWWSWQITAAPATLELSSGIVRKRGGMGGSGSRQSAFGPSKLRRELQELIEEAVKLGVLDADEEESSDEKEDFKKEDLALQNVEKSHPLEV